MKRKVLVTLCLCMIGLAGTVTGCGSKKEETPVVEEEKKEPFRMSWKEQGYLYAARGYGEQKTSGYSIEVTGCYEAKQGIYIETSLLGPDKGEEITEAPAYPYVVVKMEYIDKEVIFR